jgi:tripartite-type tricarboxylate transporter receptor subunit TctC
MPGVPTFTEMDFPEVQASAWFGYFAPVKTPKPVLDKLRAEFLKAVNTREVRQQLLVNGMYPVGDGPEQLTRTLQADTARWAQVVKATNFKAAD